MKIRELPIGENQDMTGVCACVCADYNSVL